MRTKSETQFTPGVSANPSGTTDQLVQGDAASASPSGEKPVLRTFGKARQKPKFEIPLALKDKRLQLAAGAAVLMVTASLIAFTGSNTDTAPDPQALIAPKVEQTAEPTDAQASIALASPALTMGEAPVADAVPEGGAVETEAAPGQVNPDGSPVLSKEVEALIPKTYPAYALADFRDGKTPDPGSLEEAMDQLRQLKGMLPSERPVQAEPVAKAEPKKAKSAQSKDSISLSSDQIVSLMIFDVNAEHALVADAARPDIKIAVTPGASLPGGATFIGFDTKNRVMKTDQGDFLIP